MWGLHHWHGYQSIPLHWWSEIKMYIYRSWTDRWTDNMDGQIDRQTRWMDGQIDKREREPDRL